MKKIIALITMLVVMRAVPASSHAEVVQFPKTPVIGIAWRADTDSEFFTNICKTVEAAGASWVMLDQVKSPDLEYDADGKLTQHVTALGTLDEAAAKYVRLYTWHDSNAASAVGDVSLVLFTGGADVSPPSVTGRRPGMALWMKLTTMPSGMFPIIGF